MRLNYLDHSHGVFESDDEFIILRAVFVQPYKHKTPCQYCGGGGAVCVPIISCNSRTTATLSIST